MNAKPHSRVVVAADGPALVALLAVGDVDRRRLRHSARLAFSVVRSHWGQALAPRMRRWVHNWAAGAGWHWLEIKVYATHLRGLWVDLAAGFAVEGVCRQSLRLQGQWVDEYEMAWLGSSPDRPPGLA